MTEEPNIPPAPIEEEIEDLGDEIDDVLETIEANDLIAAERHGELVEGVHQCRESLSQLESRLSQTTESPMLSRIVEELSQIRATVVELKTKMENWEQPEETPPTPSANPPQPNGSPIPSNQPQSVSPAVPEVVPPEPQSSPKKRRRCL